jgi:fatty acid desaturase
MCELARRTAFDKPKWLCFVSRFVDYRALRFVMQINRIAALHRKCASRVRQMNDAIARQLVQEKLGNETALVTPNSRLAALKVVLYFGLLALLWTGIVVTTYWPFVLTEQVAIGIVFAHGLELQHQALHNALFNRRSLNRFFGTIVGAPMLVSYTHYQVQHLHHHQHVGTERDAELFDYSEESLRSPLYVVCRAWNIGRIPHFLLSFAGFLQGQYPRIFSSVALRRRVFGEYLALALLLVVGAGLSALVETSLVWKMWFVPWLLAGEPAHFLIELPEHLGCDRKSPNSLENTRSYRTHPIWRYLTNSNNYHVEHHLAPRVQPEFLHALHNALSHIERNKAASYSEAVRQVFGVKATPRLSRNAL